MHAIVREPSKPLYGLADIVYVRISGEKGQVKDLWTEGGYIHWYTVNLETTGLRDFAQDELEA